MPQALESKGAKLQRCISVPETRALPVKETARKRSGEQPRKKVVFADDCGFELVKVRTISEPFLPSARTRSCQTFGPSSTSRSIGWTGLQYQTFDGAYCDIEWAPEFEQPISHYSAFCDKLDTSNVMLQAAFISPKKGQLIGTVRVRNIHYEKQITVRYSVNQWASYTDFAANYIPTSFSNEYDDFEFRITLPRNSVPESVTFCVCYRVGSLQEFWDSNEGKNYTFIASKTCSAQNRLNNRSPGAICPRTTFY